MLKPDALKTTSIIRHNEGMYRDCLWVDDIQGHESQGTNSRIFIIRQVSFKDLSNLDTGLKTKEIRLTRAEAEVVFRCIGEELKS